MKLKIMSYNVASGRTYYTYSENGQSPVDIKECAKVIRSVNPIFCGINEINIYGAGDEANQPRVIADLAGFDCDYFSKTIDLMQSGMTRRYGNAMLSKPRIISAETVRIPDPVEKISYESRAIAKVKLDIAGGITVLQTHFGLSDIEKKNAADTVCRLLDEIDGPVVLMGDFNIYPDNELHKGIRERMLDCADVRDGFIKTFPSFDRKPNGSSYPGCKIDYIYVSKHFSPLSFDTVETKASDHLPVIAEVEL